MANRKQGRKATVAKFTDTEIHFDINEHKQLHNRNRRDKMGVRLHPRNRHWFVASTSPTKTTFKGIIPSIVDACAKVNKVNAPKASKAKRRKAKKAQRLQPLAIANKAGRNAFKV